MEIEESPSSTRSFTVQFLPERLAGILAQAERYARQTLLPLISQYTPSFVGAGRTDRPKYFPPLGDIEKTTEQMMEKESTTEKINDPKINVVSNILFSFINCICFNVTILKLLFFYV